MSEENWETDRSEDRIVSDYISREAAITTFKTFYGLNLRNMLAALDEIPAADVRPVVLCKDCLHEDCAMYHGPNWFCADGEKREETIS